MTCCTPVCQKWTSIGFSVGLLISGFLMIFCWENLVDSIMNHQLTLVDGTFQYKAWMDAPVDVYMEMFIFNWTNVEEFKNLDQWVKPKFEELGPYVYSLKMSRANVKFHENNTVSYNTIRTYKFEPDRTKGSLDDPITIINPVQMTIASIMKDKHYLLQRGTHYFFKRYSPDLELYTNIRNLTFDGISHPAMDIAKKLKLINGYVLPFDKFGWFYARNGSETYEGDYTIYTGVNDIRKTGIVNEWNYKTYSDAYEGECANIHGCSGDVFHPVKDDDMKFSLFQSDFCGMVTLDRSGSKTVSGIEGNHYISTDKMFDNGTKYPEMSCFNPPGASLEYGLRNLTICQYRAPAFISLPHFYLGDESLVDGIEGMKPDPEKHQMYFTIEPKLGLPLRAYIVFQANMKLYNAKYMDMFQNVEDTTIPLMWIRVQSGVPDSYIPLIKLSFIAPTIGVILGYLFVVLGLLLFILGVFLDIRMRKGEISYRDYLRTIFSKNSVTVAQLSSSSSILDDRKSV